MRTSVQTNPTDPDETDEFPGCAGSADAGTGELIIVDDTDGIEATYSPGEWVAFTTTQE